MTMNTRPKLLVNIDHVATLRNARGEGFPDPARAAGICEAAGADGIVFHIRSDRRHIRDEDLPALKAMVKGTLDFEMAATQEMVDLCIDLKPSLCTLVPEGREELTTEGGLDLPAVAEELTTLAITPLQSSGIPVSLFVDPVPAHIDMAAALGVEAVELHTGTFANAWMQGDSDQVKYEVGRIADAAELAHQKGLLVNAGHGLNLDNLHAFLSAVSHLHEISIGHALISDALFLGLSTTVKAYLALIHGQTEGT
tara:strand:+ start:464 stop:1225 length:762 start_codon:yes stop_codon:yes gene_type:complete